jgi:DNA-binding transcriptional LysR family regulator
MQVNRFSLSSDQCELLLDFEDAGSIAKLSERRSRDISVVSRQIQRLASEFPVLEKRSGQWVMTALGKELSKWARKCIQEQKSVLSSTVALRIAAPPEFASRILIPTLKDLVAESSKVKLEIVSFPQAEVEAGLISGHVDFAFDCGRPESPLVKFRILKKEPLSLVASPEFFNRQKIKFASELIRAPHIRYGRINASLKLGFNQELSNIAYTFDTIASARAAAVAGLGWAILPAYSVRDEVGARRLRVLVDVPMNQEMYGVWWLRSNRSIERWIKAASQWLEKQELD